MQFCTLFPTYLEFNLQNQESLVIHSDMKSAGSKTSAADSVAMVLLQTGAVEGNFETWKEATRKAAADLRSHYHYI